MNPKNHLLLLLITVAFFHFATLPVTAAEHEHVCRYCVHGECGDAAGVFGLDLEGNGRRYAPDRVVDVLHIKIDVTPDFKQRTVSGTTTITITPIAKPVSQLRLDAVDLTIHDVRCSQEVADYVSTRKDLTVQFAQPIPVGRKVNLIIDHEAEPTRGLYFRTPEMGYPESDTHIWTQGETHEARYWFPCFDYPNERSSTEIICRVPPDMTVLSNGEKLSEEMDPQTKLKAVRWMQAKPHVNYLICLVAGHFKKLEKQHGDTKLGFYTQPTLAKHAANSFADTKQIMDFFEKEIGVPFPWKKYDQVTIRDFTAGGMENTTLTTLTHRTIFTTATENIRTTRRLDAHELAHQWFGDYVTCKDWSHLWLNEGFATFYTHLYEGHKYGRDAMLYGLYRDATGRILKQTSDRRAIVFNAYKNSGEQFDYRAYPKGSWVLHMLRCQLGEDLYRKCIQEYLKRHALTSVVSDDLRQVIEELSGRSMDQFFDQWVYHARFPDLKITYRWLPDTKLAKVTIEQTHKTDDAVLLFRLPTKLRFHIGEQTVDQEILITQKKQDFFVPLGKQPQVVRFDPEYSILARVTFDKPDGMLFAQLNNQDDMLGRVLAAVALGKRKTKKSVQALQNTLQNDGFYGVRLAASEALQAIHNDDAFAALVASRKQGDARVRQRVVADIAKFYRDEAQDELVAILQTEQNPAILADAIRGLGRYNGKRPRAWITQSLKSDSFRNELADASVAAIGMQDDVSFQPALMQVLSQREKAFTSRGFGSALGTLARLSRNADEKTDVREFLAGYVNHPKPRVKSAAVTALGTLGDPAAKAILETLARDDTDDRIAKAAQGALDKLQERTPSTPRELVELRKNFSELEKTHERMQKELDELKQQLKATGAKSAE